MEILGPHNHMSSLVEGSFQFITNWIFFFSVCLAVGCICPDNILTKKTAEISEHSDTPNSQMGQETQAVRQ